MPLMTSVVFAESGGPTSSCTRPLTKPPRRSAQSSVRLPLETTSYGTRWSGGGATRVP